jgi:hypothetical protein
MKNTRIAVAVILAASVFADALTVIPPVFAASPSENLISNPRFETTDENGNPLV